MERLSADEEMSRSAAAARKLRQVANATTALSSRRPSFLIVPLPAARHPGTSVSRHQRTITKSAPGCNHLIQERQMKKTVLITGCSSGFGKATARYFAEQGWNVVATMRKPEADLEVKALDNVLVTRLDVQDAASIAGAIKAGIDRASCRERV